MNRVLRKRPKLNRLRLAAGCLLLVFGVSLQFLLSTSGAQLGDRSLKISNADGDGVADYLLSFNLSSSNTLGSIKVQFCSNNPLPSDPCTAPVGFDASGATLADQTGPGGFSIGSGSDANTIILTRPAAGATPGPLSFHFTGMHNPSSVGSYYVRLQTFAGEDATGSASNDGGIAFAILNSFGITATVPPFLLFCTGVTISGLNCANAEGNYIDFGELSTSSVRSGSSQMLVATNAEEGYNVTVDGTTMTSGVNEITALTTSDVSRPGTPQFGFNLRANVSPAGGKNPTGPGTGQPLLNYNAPNIYRFVRGETIIASTQPDDMREYTASYIVNVPRGQAPGIYVSTMTYICLASF